ncbi:DUF5455 family protein [Modicisalibacter radicis]|uniref:DUF5455 family protein n=1 Tax=Halomonas sp. EAR18 TaxID=2518972 RepID=UPI00109CD42C|nr:DUF5455 family protein [Halomonas sp. EAR18]
MGALLARFARILLPLAEEFLRHFGKLFLRFFLWLRVARFGLFLIKVGIILGLVSVMADAITAVIDGLTVSMPPLLTDGFNRIMPDNFGTCVSALVLAKLAVWTFAIKDRLVSLGGL